MTDYQIKYSTVLWFLEKSGVVERFKRHNKEYQRYQIGQTQHFTL